MMGADTVKSLWHQYLTNYNTLFMLFHSLVYYSNSYIQYKQCLLCLHLYILFYITYMSSV